MRPSILFLACALSAIFAGCPLAVDDAYEFDEDRPAEDLDAGLGRAGEDGAAEASGDEGPPSQRSGFAGGGQAPECSGENGCRRDTECGSGNCEDD